MAVLQLENIHKSYHEAGHDLHILKGLNLSIEAGEMVALVGPSGSGKTTLLQIASLLDRPDSGQITIGGEDASHASERTRTIMRGKHLGFVYQFHHLLPEFTAQENIAMPLLIAGTPAREANAAAMELLVEVGLEARARHTPDQLSGGEQQRIAIARALINQPALLIADEPTGNLDPENAEKLFQLLLKLCASHKLSILMATHNMALAEQLDRKLVLGGGVLRSS